MAYEEDEQEDNEDEGLSIMGKRCSFSDLRPKWSSDYKERKKQGRRHWNG